MIDGLVDEDLCKDLLDLVTEPGWATTTGNSPPNHQNRRNIDNNNSKEVQEEEHVVRDGPPPSKWERGLTDVDEGEEEDGDCDDVGGDGAGGRGAGPGSWGLTEDSMEWLCRDGEHPAIVEVSLFAGG